MALADLCQTERDGGVDRAFDKLRGDCTIMIKSW